jgi:hypothetical protein
VQVSIAGTDPVSADEARRPRRETEDGVVDIDGGDAVVAIRFGRETLESVVALVACRRLEARAVGTSSRIHRRRRRTDAIGHGSV